jgi:hypothetical protein
VSPLFFLLFLILLTFAGAIAHVVSMRRRRRRLRGLARRWQMHFAPADRLRLAERIGPKIPVLGAANVRVMDLLFRTEGHRHRYLFTVEYGLGVIRGKHRRQRVAGFDEPVRRGSSQRIPHELTLIWAPENLRLTDAYSHVWQKLAPSRSDIIPAK